MKFDLSSYYRDFYQDQNLDLSSCYRRDSKFQLLSRLLSRYMLNKCWQCVFLQQTLSLQL